MNADKPTTHHRRSTRLRGYDYSLQGAYFVTIATYHRLPLFGEIVDGIMRLSRYGDAVEDEWQKTPSIRSGIILDAFVTMPNHLHGIVYLSGPAGAYSHTPLRSDAPVPFRSPSKTIGAVVRGFKSAVTSRVNSMRGTPGQPVWQRNYYEHVIRDEHDLNLVRGYVATNPLRWALDSENPGNTLTATEDSPPFTWER